MKCSTFCEIANRFHRKESETKFIRDWSCGPGIKEFFRWPLDQWSYPSFGISRPLTKLTMTRTVDIETIRCHGGLCIAPSLVTILVWAEAPQDTKQSLMAHSITGMSSSLFTANKIFHTTFDFLKFRSLKKRSVKEVAAISNTLKLKSTKNWKKVGFFRFEVPRLRSPGRRVGIRDRRRCRRCHRRRRRSLPDGGKSFWPASL